MSGATPTSSVQTRALRAFSGAGAWIALGVLGILVQIVADWTGVPTDARDVLRLFGGLAALLGSAGLGVVLGRYRADELTQARLAPAFRRSMGLYEGLARVQATVAAVRVDAELRPGSMPTRQVIAHLSGVDIRIQEQVVGIDPALEEWNQLVPAEVERYKAGLRRSGGPE